MAARSWAAFLCITRKVGVVRIQAEKGALNSGTPFLSKETRSLLVCWISVDREQAALESVVAVPNVIPQLLLIEKDWMVEGNSATQPSLPKVTMPPWRLSSFVIGVTLTTLMLSGLSVKFVQRMPLVL